jgi:hypothetical protein
MRMKYSSRGKNKEVIQDPSRRYRFGGNLRAWVGC